MASKKNLHAKAERNQEVIQHLEAEIKKLREINRNLQSLCSDKSSQIYHLRGVRTTQETEIQKLQTEIWLLEEEKKTLRTNVITMQMELQNVLPF